MKITDAPALITTPFAQNGTRNDIPANGEGLDPGRASLATGFPDETMKPITAGGVPPLGADFNGILYALSNAARFYGAGGHYKFNADFASKIGGYPMGSTVQASDNMGHWLNVVEANSANPESGLSTGWLPLADHNGTAAVTLTGSTTLTPLQAAKANLRFTGAPTGNVTVTFPAWTKRYSIINDCTGDQSIICTTGNGESISIKNGAKYEVGCDGNNLTIATVNASQVFAEPNKNVSALDAPTVQQIINALGSMASQNSNAVDISGGKATLERLNLSGGGSIFSDSSKGTIGIVNDAGDTLYLEPSNGLTYTSNDGVRHMRWEYGKLVVGEVPAERITGLGSMASQNSNAVDISGGKVLVDDVIGFSNGGRIFHDSSTDAIGIRNASGDTLYIEKDGKLTFATSEGVVRNQWSWGEQVVGEIDKSHVKNLGSMADQDAGSVTITGGTATLDRVTLPGGGYLFSNKDTGTIGIKNASGDTLYIEPNNGFTFTSNEGTRRIRWEYGRLINGVIPVERIDGLGVAARKGVFDTNNWRDIPWDGEKVVTASTARSLADQTALNIEDIESLKSSKIDIGRLSGLGLGRQGDSGYVSIPYDSGNGVQYMWIQWTWWAGNVSATATANGMFEGYADITWPRPFPNDCSFASPTINDVAGGGLMESVWLAGDSNTSYDANGARIQFATKANGGARMSGNIFAIGF